jgi:quercetin dioxygenase-like cupin family protein
MKRYRLTDMVGGWMVGDFEPSCVRTSDCEVACKHYAAGASEGRHVHRVATELTLVVAGRARMEGQELEAGDIVLLAPGEASGFQALSTVTTVVVKLPSVAGDKYPAGNAGSAPETDVAGEAS